MKIKRSNFYLSDEEEEKETGRSYTAGDLRKKYGIGDSGKEKESSASGSGKSSSGQFTASDIANRYGLRFTRFSKLSEQEQTAQKAISGYQRELTNAYDFLSKNPYDSSAPAFTEYAERVGSVGSEIDSYVDALKKAGVYSDSYSQAFQGIRDSFGNIGTYLDEQYKQTDEYKMLTYDSEAGQKEIDRLKQKEAERNKLRSQMNFLQAGGGAAGSYAAASGMYTQDEREAEIERLQGELVPYANVDTELEQAQSMKYYSENLQKYNEIQNRADFTANSQYRDTGTGGWWNGGIQAAFNFSDATDRAYEFINNQEEIQSAMGEGFNSIGQVNVLHLDLMEPDERKMFTYLYNTQGKEAASEYLDYIQPELNRRNMQNIADQEKAYAQQNFGTGLLSSIASVPNSLAGGLGALDVTLQNIQRDITGEYKPIDYNTNAMIPSIRSSAARQAVSESIVNATGEIKINEEEHPYLAKIFNGKSLADVYNLGMSIADSAAVALFSKGLGAIGVPQKLASGLGSSLLGGNAASQGMIEAVANGATDEQALQLGLMNGLYESLFEAVSIDNLTKDTATGFFKTMLKQGGVEASEEAMTTIANTFADIAIMAENSGYEKSVTAYMEQGMSREEAEKKAFLDSVVQVGWDAFGGFLSGGVSAGGKYAVGSVIENQKINKQNKRLYGESIDELVSEGMELTPDNKFVQKMQGKIDAGKDLSGRQITRLVNQNNKAIRSSVQQDAAQRLTELGETGNVQRISAVLAKQAMGEELSNAEQRVLSSSRYGNQVAEELRAAPEQQTGETAESVEEKDTGDINADDYGRVLAEIGRQEATADPTQTVSNEQTAVMDNSEQVPSGLVESAPHITSLEQEQSSENPVSIDEVAQKYGAQSSYVKKIYNIGSNQDVKQFDSAFERVFNYAQSGTVRLDVVKNLESIRSVLTDKQIELAYETGTAAANTAARNLEANNLAQANGKNGRKIGVVKGEGVSVEDLKKTFNDNQNIAYKILSTYAEATGIDIVLYQSEMDASGNFQGAQGRFKRGEPGTIYIDINAGLNGKHDVGNLAKYTMLRTFAHEFTHFIEKWNPMQYNEFRKVVFDTLRERGENVDDLVEAKQAAGLSYDMASREVVAEAMTDILPDTHFVQNLAEKHKSIFQKLMEKLNEFVEGLRSYFNSLGKNRSREANALKQQVGETVRYVENIVKMFDQVAEQAVENYQLTVAAEQTAEFSQEQNRGNSERGERYDPGRNDGDLQTISSGLDGRTNSGKSADGLGQVLSPKEWSALDGEKQQQIINQLDAYTYSSEEAEIVLSLSAKGDISDEDIRREAVTEMARQFYEAMQGDRVLLENDGRFRWLGDMVGLLIEDVQAIQDGTFVADEFWEQEQRRDYIDEGYATDSTNWAYENFIIDETDRARFYEVIADLNKRNYSVPRNKNGVYMIEHENKIMFTDGDFKAPTLSKVIVFDTSYEANMAHVKGRIFDEERRTAGHGEAVELLNRMYGDGFIHEYNARNYQRDDWQDRRGKGSNRRSTGKAGSGRRIFKGQYQERTSPLTDRDVLEAAANDVGISDMSNAEQAALQTFKDRLTELHELQEKRAEAGRLYKEQQFGANADRQAASQTLERMRALDDQIRTASVAVLDVEQKSVLQRVLKKARKVVEQQERDRSQAVLKRWRDRRDNVEVIKKYRSRIQKDVLEISGWATNPDGKNAVKHIPEVIRSSVIPFLTSIDFSSKSLLSGKSPTQADAKFAEKLSKLKNTMSEVVAEDLYSGYADLPPDFMERLNKLSDSIADQVKTDGEKFVINQMDSQQLKALSEIVRNLKVYIKNFNKFHNNAMFRHAYEAGDNTIQYLQGFKRETKAGSVSNFLKWQVIRPIFGFDRFGDGGVSIFREFMEADDKFFKNTKKLFDFVKTAYSEKEAKEWTSTIKTFELESGKKLSMPVTFAMSFYCLYSQGDSRRHIEKDGIRVATFQNGEKKVSDDGSILTQKDILTILNSLTKVQKEIAQKIQKFMATVGAEWGNYVSVARFGEKLFGNPDYFPINSDGRNFEATADEHPGSAALYALLNASFTKQRNDKASNRIIVYDILDVFANHMASMAQYNAYALPILDALKWLNYEEKTTVKEEKDGKTKERLVTVDSVRSQLAKAFGSPVETNGKGKQGYAESFIVNLIKSLNGAAPQGTQFDSLGKKFLSNYNRSMIAYNGRVVVQQPISIVRAAEVISYGSILNAMRSPAQAFKANKEMMENSGVAFWKSAGFFDVNISSNLVSMMKYESSVVDKISDVGMYAASKADEITWQTLWLACKYEVAKSGIKPSDSKFVDEVNHKFQEVIYRTQVVDSVLVKGEFIRDKGFFAKATSSFMSEPTTNYSLLVSAYDKMQMGMRNGESFSEAFKKHGKSIIRTVGIYSLGAILLAVTTGVYDALRDDDDYQTFMEKFQAAFGGNLVEELLPFNKIPIVADFYDLAKELLSRAGVLDTYGNPPNTVYMQWFDTMADSVEILHDRISGEKTNYQWFGGIYKLLQATSGITGLPIAPFVREVSMIWNNTVGRINPDRKLKTYEMSKEAEIKYAHLDGFLSFDEAVSELVNSGKADDENDAYFTVQGWDAGEDYSRYSKVFNAVRNNGDFDAAVEELVSHGYEESDVISRVKTEIGNWYKGQEITKSQATEMVEKYVGLDEEETTKLVNRWTCKVVTKIDFGNIKEAYLNEEISLNRAVEMYALYGGYTKERAKELVYNWGSIPETSTLDQEGFAVDELGTAYLDGYVSLSTVRSMYIKYGGYTAEEAEEETTVLEFVKQNPACDGISYAAVSGYNDYCKKTGVDPATFYDAWKFKNGAKNDYDSDGEVTISKKEKVMDYIDGLNLTKSQKDSLYYACGYAESTLNETPWH